MSEITNYDEPFPPEAWAELERDDESTEAARVHRPEPQTQSGPARARAALEEAMKRVKENQR